MEEDLYDEFGNYIGPTLDEEDQQVSSGNEERTESMPQDEWTDDLQPRDEAEAQDMMVLQRDRENLRTQIVLHEDKQFYPSAKDVYGADVETMVQDEDTQALNEPIIAPVKVKKFTIQEDTIPATRYDKEFLVDMLSFPELVRNVAIVGHLHHGKTAFMDMIVRDTHLMDWDISKEVRYTDTTVVELQRGISIKATPMSVILQDLREKSHLVNIIDCPGHVDFLDEVASSMRLVDGIVIIVDAIEGVMMQTEQIIKMAVQQQMPMMIVLNKIDRLVLELKIPPNDAYHKLRHTLEEINALVRQYSGGSDVLPLSPELGNVCFSSSLHGYCFSLKSFAQLYGKKHSMSPNDIEQFSQHLWGDYYFDSESRQFTTTATPQSNKRSFVMFILEPIYKTYAHILGGQDANAIKEFVERHLSIWLKPAQYAMDMKPLLKLIMTTFLGSLQGWTDMIKRFTPSPLEGAKRISNLFYTGDRHTKLSKSLLQCDSTSPHLLIYISKLTINGDKDQNGQSQYEAVGRVLSGTVKVNQSVRILGESFMEDEEDSSIHSITSISLSEARYRIGIHEAPAGTIIYLKGIDNGISKSATIINVTEENDLAIFKPLWIPGESVVRLGIEPLHPSELPKMLEGLRKASKTYVALKTHVEESGEHVIIGPGELYLDCVMHDLRSVFTSNMEIKVTDPGTLFRETVLETSSIKCTAQTPNLKNSLTLIAEPMEKGLAEDIESGLLLKKQRSELLTEKYGWDSLAARSIWAFGPDKECGTNLFLNDTLPSEVDGKLIGSLKESICQGFQWATREGPLCDEPLRNVKFRLLDANINSEPMARGSGQIIPTARRVCCSAFLAATPRLMEPVYSVEIQTPADCVATIYTLLARRRGHVVQDLPKPGSSLYTMKALLPMMDSFGFEVDLRTNTQGQAFCQQLFDHWQLVPGDPLDTSIVLRPLEPSSVQYLARDFMVKTRRRKGLGDDVVFGKYFDEAMMMKLAGATQRPL